MAASKVFGRDDEMRALRDAYENCFRTTAHRRQHLVLIHGSSGSGKTALATRTLQPLLQEDKGLLLIGKADATAQWSRPYDVIVSAFQHLIHIFEHERNQNGLSNTRLAEVRNAILKEFGERSTNQEMEINSDDGRLLSIVIPGFEKVFQNITPTDDASSNASTSVRLKHSGSTDNRTDAVARLRYLLGRLCQTVANQLPLVLFLDDIQWCDRASLDLLNSILSSGFTTSSSTLGGRTSIMAVFAFRDDNLEGYATQSTPPQTSQCTRNKGNEKNSYASMNSPLMEFLQRWKGASRNPESCGLQVRDIALKSVDETTLNAILSGVYGLPQMEFYSQLIYKVSSGNIYLALQCVRQLCDESLLYRCEETNEWKWDFSQLQAQDDATAQFLLNPAFSDIVRHSITALSEPTQLVLSVASCFGMEIDEEVLALLYRDEADIVPSVEKSIEEAITEGLLVSDPIIGRCAFAHDRVQQAAHALIDDVDALSFEAGYKLWKRCTPSMLMSNIYVVANLLNKGTPGDDKDPLSDDALLPSDDCYAVAKLNLEAGGKAVSIADFLGATSYLEKGVALLIRGGKGATYWADEYQLTLDLLSTTAEVHIFNQSFERVDELVEEVCNNARYFDDKYRVLMARIAAKSLQREFQEAVKMGNSILRHYGEKLPSHASLPIIISDLLHTKLALRGKSNEVLLSLPPMEDKDKIAATELMNMMFGFAMIVRSAHSLLLATRSIRLCIKYGTSAGSAKSFIMYAFVLCQMGDVEEAFRFSQLAMSLVERYDSREILPCVHAFFYYGIHHRKHPLRESIEGVKKASQIGLEVGDVEHSMFANSVTIHHSLFMGCKLQDLDVLLKDGLARRKAHEHPGSRVFVWAILQLVDRLRGVTPCVDVGAFFEASTSNLHESDKDMQLSAVWQHYATLAYILRDFRQAHESICKFNADSRKLLASTAAADFLDWLEGLISVAIARERGARNRREHMRKAKRMMKALAKKAKECPCNCGHMYDLLKAEHDAVVADSGHHRSCVKNQMDHDIFERYKSAIEKASKEGFRQVAAIAAERAGDYMLSLGNRSLAEQYWEKAQSHYLDWGAIPKASSLASLKQNGIIPCSVEGAWRSGKKGRPIRVAT